MSWLIESCVSVQSSMRRSHQSPMHRLQRLKHSHCMNDHRQVNKRGKYCLGQLLRWRSHHQLSTTPPRDQHPWLWPLACPCRRDLHPEDHRSSRVRIPTAHCSHHHQQRLSSLHLIKRILQSPPPHTPTLLPQPCSRPSLVGRVIVNLTHLKPRMLINTRRRRMKAARIKVWVMVLILSATTTTRIKVYFDIVIEFNPLIQVCKHY